ncbi:MAG: YdcF family protein [Moorea sp. SIO3I7]|uniref:YdcF family protein n=1 Tax=Moorena sp. SIO3I8 TaxID=2607833 RepID=UPI0013C0E382|nr:YdcF family protein [Moorena sp. SIO3I8]NEN94754.1 YdcF family protein [Moorena sp. SIO3I7]NEO08584.1 YdcF family protein [Moorena sp. SIO3I8]
MKRNLSSRRRFTNKPGFGYPRKTLRKMRAVFTLTILCIALTFIPIRLGFAHLQSPTPQVILTLGGEIAREKFTAEFAQQHPNLDIWVSSGVATPQAQKVFREAGIPDQQVHIDRRAIDTVTNFTSLVQNFQTHDIHHVYLITSDFHMRRSIAIAFFIFGSQGIAFTPVAIPSQQPEESWLQLLRDVGRSVVWIITGRTGASLHYYLRA